MKKRVIRTLLAAITMLAAGGIPTTSHAASNLAPNHDFEVTPLPAAVTHGPMGLWNQPVLPDGWAFEGASELFDHAAHAPGPKHGSYFVQISGSWSGPRRDCSAACVDVPGGMQRDQVYGMGYSVAPAWRNITAIPVTQNTSYTLSAWTRHDIPLDGTGAVARIRWLNAQGVPVGSSIVWSDVAPNANDNTRANYATFAQQSVNTTVAGTGCTNSTVCPFDDYSSTQWTFKIGAVTAPVGAAGAILLLGYTDSAWIGGVAYDEVCFSTTSGTPCTSTYI